MFSIQTRNTISPAGLNLLTKDSYTVSDDEKNPDGILLRSAKLQADEIGASVKAIARAGAGINNIPIEACTERGIVVFNTPGANANSVKELVLAGLLLSSRGIHEGLNWVAVQSDSTDLVKLVEKEKSVFAGNEISGKILGVVGLGAIGVLVANMAVKLGMAVYGYDPFISIEAAWGLSGKVHRCEGLKKLVSICDYITLHTPLNPNTEGLLNADCLRCAKRGQRILNFARDGLVDSATICEALLKGSIDRYVTDFPTPELVNNPRVMAIPHLGASTKEAEENCAVMAVKQLCDFLEYGNISNSVNFPTCFLAKSDGMRLLVANRNVPNMLSQILEVLADEGFNVEEMVNKHHNDIAYNIIAISAPRLGSATLERLTNIQGVLTTRQICFSANT